MPLAPILNGQSGLVVRTSLNAWESAIVTNISDITTLQSTVSTHTSQIATLTTNVGTNTSNISTLQTTVSSLVTTVTTHTSQISTINSTLTTLGTTVSTHTSQISSLTSALTNKQDKDSPSNLNESVVEVTADFSDPGTEGYGYESVFYDFKGTNSQACNLVAGTIFPTGKRFAIYNDTDPGDSFDITITPGGGVVVFYSGSLNATISPREYAEIIKIADDIWVRVH